MESTLNDFFNEIDEIIPLKNDHIKNENNEWKECVDSKSGFSYYWNIQTNEVTWEKPKGFVNTPKGDPVPNFDELKDKIKIYKIAPTKPISKSNGNLSKTATRKITEKKKPNSDSEDEKITLITSYGSNSSSEDENEEPDKHTYTGDDMLSTVLKRAEELKKLGNIDTKKVIETKSDEIKKVSEPISGFSLVAGYDSNSEDESDDEKSLLSKSNQSSTSAQTHSTLFPIMKTPNVSDFQTEGDIPHEESKLDNSFDMKNFKRKRRLGVNFVPIQSNVKPPSPNTIATERKGLGFKENENEMPQATSKSLYSNFTKGGVEFVKSEDVAPKEEKSIIDESGIAEIYEILHEKLAFLCEGNKDIMPVQIILIQIETLYGALKAKSLKPEYLHDWLQGTSEDLIKLEKEAAPEDWSLQWDRLQKRYYYQNKESGQTQWEFPQTEFDRQEEAMDICTTPPPPDITENLIQEGENSNRIPSPPPAPIISKPDPEFLPESKALSVAPPSQPLPPGVDYVESAPQSKSDIDSAFNTFYSELAEIEKTSKPSSPTAVPEQTETTSKAEENLEPVKKKRKKMKLGQGLSLKRKDVSKLVEKWRNAQNNY